MVRFPAVGAVDVPMIRLPAVVVVLPKVIVSALAAAPIERKSVMAMGP